MRNYLRIPMQFFAESAEGEAKATQEQETAQGETEAEQKSEPKSDKTFSQEDVNRMIAERLDRERKKFAAEKEEAAELAKMNAAQKAEHAAKKREEELTNREKAVAEKELRFTALGILEENSLPPSLVDCLNLTSAEACNKSIEAMKKAWAAALTAAVDERLKSNPPAYSGGNKTTDPFSEGFGI